MEEGRCTRRWKTEGFQGVLVPQLRKTSRVRLVTRQADPLGGLSCEHKDPAGVFVFYASPAMNTKCEFYGACPGTRYWQWRSDHSNKTRRVETYLYRKPSRQAQRPRPRTLPEEWLRPNISKKTATPLSHPRHQLTARLPVAYCSWGRETADAKNVRLRLFVNNCACPLLLINIRCFQIDFIWWWVRIFFRNLILIYRFRIKLS